MPRTTILEPFGKEDKITSQMTQNLKKIRNLMTEFFDHNTLMSWEEILLKLQLSEGEYIAALRCSLKNAQVFLKRSSLEVAINAYNEVILNLNRYNMDIQFILNPYSCASYVVNYISKAEGGLSKLLRQAEKDSSEGNLSVRERLRKIGNVFINGSVMSAQEACYHVLSLPLSLMSRSTVFINTSPPDERVRMLKSVNDLQNELEVNPDSDDIFLPNILEKYARRAVRFENICLADFACNLPLKLRNKVDDSDEDNSYEIPTHNSYKTRILRFRTYKEEQDPVNFHREQVILFLPWRNEQSDIIEKDCAHLYAQHSSVISKNRAKYFSSLSAEILENVMEQAQNDADRFQQDDEDDELEHPVDVFVQGGVDDPKKADGSKYTFKTPALLTRDQILANMLFLNEKQRDVVMHVIHCFKTNVLPIRLFLSGSAGVGKSTVIKTIYQLLTHHFSHQPETEKVDNPVYVLLTAPSGKAAFLIGGITLHSAFALPVTQYGGQMPELSEDIANTIRCNLSRLKLLIIDEVSMCGSLMFHRIDTRLRQIMGRDVSFGGVSVLLVGDLNQLPPVQDSPIFKPSKGSGLTKLAGTIIWDEFKYFELTEIMRQKDEIQFIKALNNVAIGKMTFADVATLQKRQVEPHEVPTTAIRLYQKNIDVDSYNDLKIKLNENRLIECTATDSIMIKNCTAQQKERFLEALKKKNRTETGGLPYKISLKTGIKYMIISNIDIADGLVNGACGVLERVTPEEDPRYLWLNFGEERVGRERRQKFAQVADNFFIKNKSWVPISRISVQISLSKKIGYQSSRTQFPLVPAEALTIHKSQGQTYDSVCLDFNKIRGVTRSMLYVALSRVRKLDDLFILGKFKPPKEPLESDAVVLALKDLRENKVLNLSFSKVFNGNLIKIIYQNCRSLKSNAKYIKSDPWYLQADLIISYSLFKTARYSSHQKEVD